MRLAVLVDRKIAGDRTPGRLSFIARLLHYTQQAALSAQGGLGKLLLSRR